MNAIRLVVLAGLAGALSTPLTAQTSFILRKGADTIAVEEARWRGDTLTAESVIRVARARTTIALAVDGKLRPTGLSSKMWLTSDSTTAAPRQSATLSYLGDSVFVKIEGGGQSVVQRIGSKAGALPYFNPSIAMIELAITRAYADGIWPATIPLFMMAGGQTVDATLTKVGSDSVAIMIVSGEMRLRVDDRHRIQGGTIPSQGLTIERLAGRTVAFVPEKLDYSAPAGAPYRAIDVKVSTPMGHHLAGTLTIPLSASPSARVPAVVTITGSGAQDRDEYIPLVVNYRPFRQLADSLGRRGIAVLRMDDRGYGGSGGNAATATSADFADDIRAGLEFLRQRPEIDGSRLALMGHSEGGIIAPMVAATDRRLAGIVLLAGPSRPGRPILEYQLRNNISQDTSNSPRVRDSLIQRVPALVDSMAASQPWLKFFLTHDPAVVARKVTTPTYIVQGATDQQVTADQAAELRDALKAAGNKDVTMRVFPNLNHLFIYDPNGFPGGYTSLKSDGRVDPAVVGSVVEWLIKRLVDGRPKAD